jgi:putative hydrolase of the HAD superfamily
MVAPGFGQVTQNADRSERRSRGTPLQCRAMDKGGTKPRAIFFDVDDTLYSTTEFAKRARTAAVKNMIRFGFRMQTNDCLRELDEVITEFSSNYEQHFDKLLLRIPPHYYEGINPAILVAAAVAGYHDTKMRELSAHEDVREVLKLLKKYTPLKLGVITNGITVKQAEKIVRLDIYELLDARSIYISDQMGINKPNTKFFLRACRESGVQPPEAMYVGDHASLDIDPPNKIGMITVHSRRGGRHAGEKGESQPDHVIHNFWDLLEILERDYGFDIEAARRAETAKGG